MELHIDDGIGVLHMRAGKGNAMNERFLAMLEERLDEVAQSDARALVVTGDGAIFSVGLDLPALVDLDRDSLARFLARFEAVLLRLFMLERPTIAAVNGHAIAGGCVLALQADWRVMALPGGTIGLTETQLGLGLPAFVLETLRAQVPPTSLGPIALEGRLFGPEDARALGLVHETAPAGALMERAMAKARELAKIPRTGYAQVKRGLRAPVLAAIAQAASGSWLDTFYSPEAQERVRETVARLSKKR